MSSTNETKVTTNELNSDGKDATETQERHYMDAGSMVLVNSMVGISGIVVSYATAFL